MSMGGNITSNGDSVVVVEEMKARLFEWLAKE
jgi:hypothetical protein